MVPKSLLKRYVPSDVFLPGILTIPLDDAYCLFPRSGSGRRVVVAATVVACVGFGSY